MKQLALSPISKQSSESLRDQPGGTMMKSNMIHCYLQTDTSLTIAKSEVVVAPISSLDCLSIGLNIRMEDQQQTIFFPHSSIPALVQGLSSAYFSIADIESNEEVENAK
jgi:hypothetical protein